MRPLFDCERKDIEVVPSLRIVFEARQRALTAELARMQVHDRADRVAAIVTALEAIGGLLTGDLDRIPAEAADQLRVWIRHSRSLGAKGTDAR